jgi:hypothetical protein
MKPKAQVIMPDYKQTVLNPQMSQIFAESIF